MNYRFRASPTFRKALARLTPDQKRQAKAVFAVFRQNPFDPRLRTHKIHKLSALYGKTIHAVRIEDNLRAVFFIEGNVVMSVDIGSHAIYR